MKQVAILLLLGLLLNGCGNNSSSVQTATSGTWQSQMLGGDGQASGFSFITQFNVGGNGALSISSFQFLTSGPCLPVDGGTVSGSVTNLIVNQTTFAVTGDFSFAVASGGNTLTLTGTLTGTENGTTGTILSGASVTGTWNLTGGTGCSDPTGGSFTMTQT